MIFGILLVLSLTVIALVFVKSGPRPLCHSMLNGAFQQWVQDSGHSNAYPNAGGVGSNSLALIEQYCGPDIQRYGYIPGLTYDDPKDLVLIYLKTKTHYSWHGDTSHTVFSPLKWMVISPQFHDGENTCPEGGELLDTAEFKRRVERTVEFLKENQRTDWQVVAKEQADFLSSIKE